MVSTRIPTPKFNKASLRPSDRPSNHRTPSSSSEKMIKTGIAWKCVNIRVNTYIEYLDLKIHVLNTCLFTCVGGKYAVVI